MTRLGIGLRQSVQGLVNVSKGEYRTLCTLPKDGDCNYLAKQMDSGEMTILRATEYYHTFCSSCRLNKPKGTAPWQD